MSGTMRRSRPSAEEARNLKMPDPGVPVMDDRVYYRNDKELLESALTSKRELFCKVFFGLRRFGKTCFLHRIERACNASGVAGSFYVMPEGSRRFRAEFVGVLRDRATAARSLARIADDIEKNTYPDATTVVLLDDLLDLAYAETDPKTGRMKWDVKGKGEEGQIEWAEKEEDKVDTNSVKSILNSLESLYDAYEDGADVRLILCEPTNLADWLGSEALDPYFPMEFRRRLSKLLGNITPSKDLTLSPLSPEDAWRLLSAYLDGEARVSGVSPELAKQLDERLGGNPWLMAHAFRAIQSGLRSEDTIDDVVASVEKELNNTFKNVEYENNRLFTIYGSLSREQQFLVRLMLYENHGNDDFKQFLSFIHDDANFQRGTGRSTLAVLRRMRIIQDDCTLMSVLDETLWGREQIRSKETINETFAEDGEVWGVMLKVEWPKPQVPGRFIVHQLSDIMLDPSRLREANKAPGSEPCPVLRPWKAYLRQLERWTQEARSGSAQKDERPSMIVLCGNLFASSDYSPSVQSSCGDSECDDCEKDMELIADELDKLVDYLRPLRNREKAIAKQIVIVPGIFDMKWNCRNINYTEKWNKVFKKFSLAGQEISDEADNDFVHLIALNTVDKEGAREHGGDSAVTALVEIRNQLRNEFTRLWGLVSGPVRAIKDPEQYRQTMDYLVKQGENDSSTEISRSTFLFFENPTELAPDAQRGVSAYCADAGFLDRAQYQMLDKFSEKRKKDSASGMDKVAIAVMHHHPHLRRRGAVVELYDGREFRQHLAKAGISLVLHGHSECQQVLSEKISLKSNDGRRPSRTVDMIGSGSYSVVSQRLSAGSQGAQAYPEEAPSFNRIITERNYGRQPKVKVEFMELSLGKSSDSDQIEPKGEVIVASQSTSI